jgi:saccharopine dehydrogenase (NADP+, L-glutamate forming)
LLTHSTACRTLESAKKLCSGIENTRPISLDVENSADLDAEVERSDLVISLIPYTFHATVIKSAIRKKKNVVTTSYVSDAMKELEPEVKKAGITVLNEIGLDPGIDHLYAVKAIEDIHREGGKVKSFLSYCGGLPAPEASGNALGYKFSWSSRGVLLALRNAAKFYQDGKVVEIAGPDLMASAKPYFIMPGFAFVAYPNRDSTPYRERYNIPEAQTVIRGTLRYQGFPEFVKVLVDIGFLSDQERDFLKKPIPWAEATQKILGASSSKGDDLAWAIQSKTKFADNAEMERVLSGMEELGMFSSDAITPRGNALDTLCATLEQKMQYEPGERDMVMLQHKFQVEIDGHNEVRTSTLVDYGDVNGYSAMARLVGVPCGVACLMVLSGKIALKGVLAPVNWELAEPLLVELRKFGIELKEEVKGR